MKRGYYALILSFMAVLLCLSFGLCVNAEEGNAAVISEGDGGYIMTNAGEVTRAESLSELLSFGGEYIFDGVNVTGELALPLGDYTFSGNIGIEGSLILGEGTSLTLSSAQVTLGGQIRVLGGSLSLQGGSVSGAIVLDYSATSRLEMSGGEVSADGSAIRILRGTARLYGGRVVCPTGDAIINRDSLYLGGSVSISSPRYGVVSDTPVFLTAGGLPFGGELRVKMNTSFPKGEMIEVFRNAAEYQTSSLRLYDKTDAECSIRYFEEYGKSRRFIAVYRPFKVSYYSEGEPCGEELLLAGEVPSGVSATAPLGFIQTGWYLDESCSQPYDMAVPVTGDLKLYAGYRLLPPQFTVAGYSGTYDGGEVAVGFTLLSHPQDEVGIYSFEWLDSSGAVVSRSRNLALRDVSDSGVYICKIGFTAMGYTVYAESPPVSVEIKRCEVVPPRAEPATYTGKEIYPNIAKSSLYSFSHTGYTEVGEYEIPIVLCDSENYAWVGCEGDTYILRFSVTRAENAWIESPRIRDLYLGQPLSPSALSLFGTPRFLYSDSAAGEFSEKIPDRVGKYYLIAVVPEGESYSALMSEPVSFSILAEEVTSISVATPPDKMTYYAFESFSREGLSLAVTYNSGREEYISGDAFSVFYQSGECLLYRHSGVIAEYMGFSVTVPLEVRRLDYPAVSLPSDIVVTYDGAYHTAEVPEGLPMGRDGIPLKANITGGGSSVGTYRIVVSFESGSDNYNIPLDIEITLTVLPMEVTPVWENLSFVYDGGVKLPVAYYYDVLGARVPLTVTGGGRTAGRHAVRCICSDGNYTLTSDSAELVIDRARYDMSGVYWSAESFFYDGGEKSVTLLGLPEGVHAFGYASNVGVMAGEYTAGVSLSYDSENYYPPTVPLYTWRILPAEYDMSGVGFVGGESVYDGRLHYPTLVGTLPTGSDGSTPTYRFDGGVINVSDGVISVRVIFESASSNYIAPSPVSVDMWVIPAPCEISWVETTFVYTGEVIIPVAYAEGLDVRVYADGVNAGVHKAFAESLNPNYKITNSMIEYRVLKKENSWTVAPTVDSFYVSGTPKYRGKAEWGEAVLLVYLDAECKTSHSGEYLVGEYYGRLFVPESENYKELYSPVIAFSVLEVVPVALRAEIFNPSLRAFDKLGANDLGCYLIYSDGSERRLSFGEIEVNYLTHDSLRAGSFEVLLEYGDIGVRVLLSVGKRAFDLSGVMWDYGDTVYSGEKKHATLIGLPEGLLVAEYVGNGQTEVGEYPIRAILSYDTENYEAPDIPEGRLVITKRGITPRFEAVTYDGESHSPIAESELYYTMGSYSAVGVYRVRAILYDSKNYYLLGGDTAYFVINPRPITVKIADCEVYLFEKPGGFTYEVVGGDVVEGEELGLRFSVEGDEITAVTDNRSYTLTVLRGSLRRINRLAKDDAEGLFILSLLFVTLALGAVIIIFKRDAIRSFSSAFVCRMRERSAPIRGGIDIEERLLTVDGERADVMISDSIARTLLERSDTVITEGRRRAVVNLDTISASFSAGDRVDVNSLKERGLVPRDTLYVKVLARGEIDKPLTVYANSFSLTAVKMIALTGGAAVKVKAKRL